MVTKNKPIEQTLRQKVWNYMRRNRNFVVGDVIAITGIKYGNLRDMLKAFEVVEYIKTVSKEKPLTSNRYKLVKCTGVKVPKHNKKKQLFYDPNLDIEISTKRIPSILKIVNALNKSPISKEEINVSTMLSHATDVKCYAKLKEFNIITRISPIVKNSNGHVLFTIDFEKVEEFKKKVENEELDLKTLFDKSKEL